MLLKLFLKNLRDAIDSSKDRRDTANKDKNRRTYALNVGFTCIGVLVQVSLEVPGNYGYTS